MFLHIEGEGTHFELLLDALIDSGKVFLVAFLVYFILSFFEKKLTKFLHKKNKYSPVIGSAIGIIPQCGISVVAADLYIKKHITVGTLFAVFISCSDEALPLLLSSDRAIDIIPLILIKFVFGFIFGYLVDFFISKKDLNEIEEPIHDGCGYQNEDKKIHKHFIHPFMHAVKIFCYVLVFNIIFAFLLHLIGEDNIINFINKHVYFTPVFCGVLGLVPNCASSVLITELYIRGGIPFGAMVTGLSVNAGLGLVYLFKNGETRRKTVKIAFILLTASILLGYGIIFIMKLF